MTTVKAKSYVFNGKEYPCCASLTMGLIGGKWKTVILYYLMHGTLRYNELRRNMPTVTERTLSLQLKKLEEDGIIERRVYTQKPPLKVEYSLTKLGESLVPLIKAISEWGFYAAENHDD
ncbi:transcriptional regulator [Prolixibacteraceae bacterium JC049]|nr:transcriptional regulator [Prolixibacteraceae bacterium JC049]